MNATRRDIQIEVDDDGDVWFRMPRGWALRLDVPASLVPYYRRLADAEEERAAQTVDASS